MAFPETPLPVIVEMWTGQWVDITNYVRATPGNEIVIRRGFADEGGLEPSSCTLTLDNRDGRFSPRNPLSPYYGLIGRNTPIRVRIGERVAGDGYLLCEGTSLWQSSFASTSSSGGVLAVTSDIDVRVDALAYEWHTNTPLIARFNTSHPTGRSWALLVDTSGNLVFTWSTDGTAGTVKTATSTIAAGLVNGQRAALRATLDVDNGSDGWTVTFYTADTINGTWVQLGAPVTDAGTTSIFDSAALEVGHIPEFGQTFPTVRIYAAQLLDGIGGTALADVDFGEQNVGDESFTDDAGRTWTVGQEARIADPGVRFVGEVSEWPPKWDVSGSDYWTPVTAQGINRRLGQGDRPAKSPVRSATEGTFPFLVAYWPMEEAGGTSFTSALSYKLLGIQTAPGNFPRTVAPMAWTGTRPDFAATGAFLGSQPLPILASTTSLTAPSPPLPAEGYGLVAVGMHIDVPVTTGWADNTPILWIQQAAAGSTVATWELRYKSGSGGDLEVRALDESGAELDTTGTLNVDIDGDFHRLFLRLNQPDPSDPVSVTLTVRTLGVDGTAIDETSVSDSFPGLVLTTATGLRIAPTGGLTELGVGHVTVFWSGDDISDDALLAFAGEYAATRAVRLLEEVGVEARVVGTTVDSEAAGPAQWRTQAMGAQAIPTTFREAFAECPVADQALVFESRDDLGPTFRTRSSLYNQLVALTLDFEAPGEIAPDLEAIDDDQLVRNDVTVRRKGGSSARAVDTTSRMGTAPPPDGVGIYETEVEVNIQTDAALPAHAGWRLHLGTWDEPRFPQLVVNQTALAAAGKYHLVAAAAGIDIGDRARLQNLPLQAGVIGDVDVLALGYVERIGLYTWELALNTRPYGPWNVGTWQASDVTSDDSPTRWDSAFSTVGMGLLLPGANGSYASTLDAAELDITGDLDVRCRAAPTAWANEQDLVTKWQTTGDERAFQLYLDGSGNLVFEWSPDGASVEQAISTSSVDSITASGPLSVRATLDVDNGSSGWTVTFYTSTGADLSSATWTRLGDAVTGTGTTSIFASTADLEVGSFGGGNSAFVGVIESAQVRDGIDGAVVANPNFAAQTSGTTSFEDSAGLTWTVSGSAEIYGPFVTGTDDTMLVTTAAGPLWTTVGPFPLDIAVHGVKLTVSSITGTTSPQTFTISDANLSAVTIPSGAEVHVADRGRHAL